MVSIFKGRGSDDKILETRDTGPAARGEYIGELRGDPRNTIILSPEIENSRLSVKLGDYI